VLNRDNLVSITYFQRATLAARAVGRVDLRRARGGRNVGFGTGFLVSPRLLLTNNHVLGSPAEARYSLVEFNYQEDISGRPPAPSIFALQPEVFFLTSPYEELDYALVAVAEQATDGTRLASMGWNRLIEAKGKAMIGEYLNIIQHPEGRPKQLALRDNLLVDMLKLHLHYQTDTLPGSSGSPVYNDDWEVVALHHSGVPRSKDGQILKKDGTPADETTSDDELDWVANEGVRISEVVGHVKREAGLTAEAERLRAAMLDPNAPSPIESALPVPIASGTAPVVSPPVPPPVPLAGAVTVTLPLHITVQVGQPLAPVPPPPPSVTVVAPPASDGAIPDGAPTGAASDGASSDAASVSDPTAVSPRILPAEVRRPVEHYAGRQGYDADFLDVSVPLPDLGPHLADAAPVEGAPADAPFVLPYVHFSVVVSKARRMPRFTAVNIDGRQSRDLRREGDAWFFDPRVDEAFQAGNAVYKNNPLDRGHMVRRLDPVWGEDAQVANDDTYHFTNACPQHENLNQKTWSDLEEYILGNAKTHDLKVSVLTGPVLAAGDPRDREFQIPREFWKIAVIVNADTGKLSATAYLLSQGKMIRNLPEAFVFGAYRTYQIRVADVEARTGLRFGPLAAADPLGRGERAQEALGAGGLREIHGPGDLVLG
jgi:endonuclease G